MACSSSQTEVREIEFPNIGNYPLKTLINQYGNVPIQYVNLCEMLKVPSFYYYPFKRYMDLLECYDMDLVNDLMYEVIEWLHDEYNIFDEKYYYNVYILFDYMVSKSHPIFDYRHMYASECPFTSTA